MHFLSAGFRVPSQQFPFCNSPLTFCMDKISNSNWPDVSVTLTRKHKRARSRLREKSLSWGLLDKSMPLSLQSPLCSRDAPKICCSPCKPALIYSPNAMQAGRGGRQHHFSNNNNKKPFSIAAPIFNAKQPSLLFFFLNSP